MADALGELIRAELLNPNQWPAGRLPATVLLPESSRLIDIRDAIETQNSWVFSGHSFVSFWGAQSDTDRKLNDYVGRPRNRLVFSVRFVRVSASASFDEISAGATLFEYAGSVPDGVEWKFDNSQERSYTEGVQGLEGDTATVKTQRATVKSGLVYSGRTMLIPGGYARCTGTLNVSGFVGKGLDRNETAVPLTCDLRRGEWTAVHMLTGGDASAVVSFTGRQAFNLSGGLDRIRVDVRVDG